MAVDFRIMPPRIFSDERLYRLDSDHKWIYAYCVGGLQNCGLTEIGIYRIGRGEIAVGANVDMKKTEEIIAYFNENSPELLRYDIETHMIFLPSQLKYLLRYNFFKIGLPVVKAVHKDFKRYGKKAPAFFAEFSKLYHDILNDSIRQVSLKDTNYPYYRKTFDELFALEELYFLSKA